MAESNFHTFKPSDILVVFGLEQGLDHQNKHVLPPNTKSIKEMRSKLADLMSDFPGTVIVIRSIMAPGNCIFSENAMIRHNLNVTQKLHETGILSTGYIRKQSSDTDELQVHINPVSRNNKKSEFLPQFEANKETDSFKETNYFEFSKTRMDNNIVMLYESANYTARELMQEYPDFVSDAPDEIDVEECLTCLVLAANLMKLSYDTTENIHFRNLVVPFMQYLEEKKEKYPEVMDELASTTPPLVSVFTVASMFQYDREAAKKYLKYLETDVLPKIEATVSAAPYNMCTIRHDKISKDLKVDKFCTSRSEQTIHPDFMSALQKRKAPTLVSFRDNNHSFGFGENSCIRSHNMLNSIMDDKKMAIPSKHKKDLDQYLYQTIGREVETTIDNEDRFVKHHQKFTNVMEYLMSRVACRSYSSEGEFSQYNTSENITNQLATRYNIDIKHPLTTNEETNPYDNYYQIFSQNIYFAGIAPSHHTIPITLNSLTPFLVERKTPEGFKQTMLCDMKAVLLTAFTALPKPKHEFKSEITGYDAALYAEDTPLYRRMLWTVVKEGNNTEELKTKFIPPADETSKRDSSYITNDRTLRDAFGPLSDIDIIDGVTDSARDYILDEETTKLLKLLLDNGVGNSKPLDLGCNVLFDPKNLNSWRWGEGHFMKGTEHNAMPCNTLGGMFSLKTKESLSWLPFVQHGQAELFAWSPFLPVKTSLKTLDTYKHLSPDRQAFAHVYDSSVTLNPYIDTFSKDKLHRLFSSRIEVHHNMFNTLSRIRDKSAMEFVLSKDYINKTPTDTNRLRNIIDLTTNKLSYKVESFLEHLDDLDFTVISPPTKQSNVLLRRANTEGRELADIHSAYHIESKVNSENETEYLPKHSDFVQISHVFTAMDKLPHILILLVELSDDWSIHNCTDGSALYGIHTIVVVFGSVSPHLTPTTEALYALYPFANYICNLTSILHDTLQPIVPGVDKLMKKVQQIAKKERSKLMTHIKTTVKSQQKHLNKLTK